MSLELFMLRTVNIIFGDNAILKVLIKHAILHYFVHFQNGTRILNIDLVFSLICQQFN